eukprot:scaffold4939_cov105-Phaeocystis_antarctica.AAC.2
MAVAGVARATGCGCGCGLGSGAAAATPQRYCHAGRGALDAPVQPRVGCRVLQLPRRERRRLPHAVVNRLVEPLAQHAQREVLKLVRSQAEVAHRLA